MFSLSFSVSTVGGWDHDPHSLHRCPVVTVRRPSCRIHRCLSNIDQTSTMCQVHTWCSVSHGVDDSVWTCAEYMSAPRSTDAHTDSTDTHRDTVQMHTRA